MPTGIYVRTEECNKAHRVKKPGAGIYQHKPEHIARFVALGFKKGNIPWNKGIPFTEVIKKKMSIAQKGKPRHTEEHKKELSIKMLGNKFAYKNGETIWTSEYRRRWYREHYAKNIDKLRKYCSARSSIRRMVGKGGVDLPLIKLIQRVYEDNIKQFGTLTCYLCGKPIEFKQDSLEHKIPLSRGGTNEYDNLAVAHLICNKKKSIKTEAEYKEVCNVD